MNFEASGKLLMFGEYFVLRGAKCFAMPLSYGQKLQITSLKKEETGIEWEAYGPNACWLKILFTNTLEIQEASDREIAQKVQKLLKYIKKKNPSLYIENLHFSFEINFDRQFGFGTSSTFISLLSQWAKTDPYELLANSFGGSGYDIAAATADKPFVYSKEKKIQNFCPLPDSITNYLLFVYLGNKQKTATEIKKFEDKKIDKSQIEKINNLVFSATQCKDIIEWENLMETSEKTLAKILQIDPVKKCHFSDYSFAIKSLGAWGGDFIMASCRDLTAGKKYFEQKNKHPIYTYKELIK